MDPSVDWLELLSQLAEPFPTSAIRWRVGKVSRDKKTAKALPYVESREYEDRLNQLCRGNWSVTFEPWGNRIICKLTIHGITRSSTGEPNEGRAPGTSAEAQAFKRACSKFKLGRYLYNLPSPWVAYDPVKKQLLEKPKLDPTLTTMPTSSTLTKERASAMHKELARLGIPRTEHYAFASKVLDKEIKSFTTLTEDEATLIWKGARKKGGKATTRSAA